MALTMTRPAIPVPLPLTRGGTEATTPAGARGKLELGDLALLTAPGGTSTFLRADKTWAVPPGGGGGGGDVSSSAGLSVDSELAIFDGTSGKLLKRGTGSGLALLTNGVLSIKAAPTGTVVGTTDTQTLTGKTIAGASNTLSIREADLALSDLTTADVSTARHGLLPKAPGGTTLFFRADATWAVPAGGGGGAPTDAEYITSTTNATLSAERVLTDTATITWDRATAGQIKANAIGGGYTDEQAQDAVGAMLVDTATIDLTYTDATPSLSASVIDGSITEAKLGFTDVATKDASTTAHGLLRKLSGTATQYLDGSGAWTTPAGGESFWEHSPSSTLLTGLLAFWRMEEASGNRVDSVASMALTPQGTTAQITTAAGKTGNALRFPGGYNAWCSIADTPTLSVGTSSFSVGFWLYFDGAPSSGWGLVGKGDVNVNNNGAEYLFWINGTAFEFVVGSGSSHVVRTYPGVTPTTGTWYFLVGWYDAALDTQYFQVNNGTVASVANTAGSFDSTGALEIGRQVGWAGSPFVNMRVENLFFYKRILTDTERAQHWNSGNGLDYPLGMPPVLYPTTLTDHVGIGTESATEWLEVAGALKIGTALGTADGTLRWSGTDFEGRKAGTWTSLTGAGLGTMAQQDAYAVAITGGSATLDSLRVHGPVGLGKAPGFGPLEMLYDRSYTNGIVIIPTSDTEVGSTMLFVNAALGGVGAISTTATSTAFSTTSDARLKHSITPLTGALDVVQRLRPITHLWNADGSRGYGFLAHELQQVVPDAVTGEPDAVHEDGSIKPQQVDHSRLVPWLTAALQETLAQVQALTARVASLEEQLGL